MLKQLLFLFMGGYMGDEGKSNSGLLLGIVIIILGIQLLLKNVFNLDFGKLSALICGGALILLYVNKKKVWALVLGIVLVVISSQDILRQFSFFNNTVAASLIFLIPGIIFFVLYSKNKSSGFLITSSFLIWLGIGYLLSGIGLSRQLGNIFFGCSGFAFVTIYFFGKEELGKWPIVTGCIILAFWMMSNIFNGLKNLFAIPHISWIILIIAGILIVRHNINKDR